MYFFRVSKEKEQFSVYETLKKLYLYKISINLNSITIFQNNDNLDKLDLYNLHDLKINDEQFDYCVAHACIHHSSKPHNAVLEMYRVSKKGILIIESTDSLLSRVACHFNLSEEFELSAVKKNISFEVCGGSKEREERERERAAGIFYFYLEIIHGP